MDWLSWLSKSGLEPPLVYEYSLAFTHNELEQEDITYFNHEFLQSMGISVAKHRIEILKLAKEEIGGSPYTISRLILAINKSKRCFTKCISRWFLLKDTALEAVPEPTPSLERWRGALTRKHKGSITSMELRQERQMLTNSRSGPLDGRVEERFMITNRSPRVSPLDRRVHDRLMLTTGSPRVSRPLNGKVEERFMITNRSPMVLPRPTGPLDGKVEERFMKTKRSPSVSGPLDRRLHGRLMLTNRSPRMSGPPDGRVSSPNVNSLYDKEKTDGDDGPHSIWASLFQDMKPT